MGFWTKLFNSFRPSADIISDGEPYWYGPGRQFVPADATAAGEAVTETNLMTSATCYACTKALSETIAGLPGEVFKVAMNRKDSDANSDASELLAEQPNPEMDSFTFWEIAVARLTNAGNFFAEIQRDNRDQPIALWPIHPSRVQPMRDQQDGSLYWEISADFIGTPQLSDPTWRRQYLRTLSPHNMLNIVGFGSRNGVMSPGVLPAGQEIAMDFATRRYGGAYFKEGTTPAGYVTHPGFIDNETKRNVFRQDMNNLTNAKRHQIGVLWQGATYEKISVDPEQAQFLETRKFTAQQLCKFYGVAPAIIGDYEDSKFATADAMIRAFVMITLRNLAVRLEKAVNRQILNVRNSNGKLERAFTRNQIFQIAIDGLLRGDPKTQADAWAAYRTMGVAKTNEIRQDIGLNPIEGPEGDYLIVNGGMARLDKIDEQGTRTAPAPKPETPPAEAAFDRSRLIEAIDSLKDRPEQVPGHNPKEEKAELTTAAIEIAESAMGRIDKITATQVERWREQDPAVVAQKLPAFFEKQQKRLAEAMSPLSSLVSPELPNEIASAYFAACQKLDNHSVFGVHPQINIKEIVNASIG